MICLGHQHGRLFIVLGYQYGRRDVTSKHYIFINVLYVKITMDEGEHIWRV